jgi:hypothetical protein
MPAARRKKREKEERSSKRDGEEFYTLWRVGLKFFVSLSHEAPLSNQSKAHSGEEMLQRIYVLQ